jgi:hypothetical protein
MDKGAYLALYINYILTDTLNESFDVRYLFHKKRTIQSPKLYEISTGQGHLLDEVEIPQNSLNPLYINAKVNYNWKGKIARLFFQPPYLMATLTYENGEIEDFRIPPPILEGGVLINKKVTNQEEFVAYHQFKGRANQNIVSLKLWSASGWGFNESFEYSFEEIK